MVSFVAPLSLTCATLFAIYATVQPLRNSITELVTPMKTDEIKLLYAYDDWAMRRILATCTQVSAEQYIAPAGETSLRATLVHILDAALAWRSGFEGSLVAADAPRESLPPAQPWDHTELTEADVPTLAALQERWQAEVSAMSAYLGTLRDEDMNGLVRYLIPGGIVRERVLWHCLVHLVNHGTQHRSEAAALLTRYGRSPGDLDFTAFLNEHFHLESEPAPGSAV
jgi:uncharacterized damage-inducible protein DinB